MAEHPASVPATSPAFDRRDILRAACASLILLVTPSAFGSAARSVPTLLAVRVWPAEAYTRVTLEHDLPIRHSHLMLRNPDRLVLDLEGIEFNAVLQSLPGKVTQNDPQIRLIRAGRHRPDVVRIVIELKTGVRPEVFSLAPVGDFRHRLVLDLYPAQEPDPLLALLREREAQHGARPSERPRAEGGAKNRERLFTVAIDAGHGGEDPGAIGQAGTHEKNITLAIARRLKRRVDAEAHMRAFMTRNGDYFVPLGQRVARARRVEADLFVSIHADAWIKPTAHGSSVFVLSETGATSQAARWLAQRENAADLIGGVNIASADTHLARTLLDLSQTATLNDSVRLARSVLGEIGEINRLHKPNVEKAGFAVLRAPDVPSILVETAFISNPAEEKRLRDTAYQEQMADALLEGIREYLAQSPPPTASRVARAL